LRAVLRAYAEDDTILTIGVFGSAARPDCDELSDIDLDVLVPVEQLARASTQIQQLVSALNAQGFPTLLVVWDGDNAAEIVLESLDRIDVTIHTPETSKAEVLRDLVLIRGEASYLPKQGIPAIASQEVERRLHYLHGKLAIDALHVAHKLKRDNLWGALVLLNLLRERVMDIYGLSRGSTLPSRYFVKHAETELREALGQTLTSYEQGSIVLGLKRLIQLYRVQCDAISNGRLQISEAQAKVFDRVEALILTNAGLLALL
jgi:hypothetical protein